MQTLRQLQFLGLTISKHTHTHTHSPHIPHTHRNENVSLKLSTKLLSCRATRPACASPSWSAFAALSFVCSFSISRILIQLLKFSVNTTISYLTKHTTTHTEEETSTEREKYREKERERDILAHAAYAQCPKTAAAI